MEEVSTSTDLPPVTIANYNTHITINNRYSGFRPIDRIAASPKKHSLSSKVFKMKDSPGVTVHKQEETKKDQSSRGQPELTQDSDLDDSYSQASVDTSRSVPSKTISENNTPNRASALPSSNTGDSGFKAEIKPRLSLVDSPSDSLDNGLSPSVHKKNKRSGFSGLVGSRKKADFLYKRESTKLNDLTESNFKDLILLQDIPKDTFIQQTTKAASGSANSIWIVRFSPDEKFLATGGADGLLRIFSLSAEIRMPKDMSGKIEPEFLLLNPTPLVFSKHTSDIVDLDWNRDSKRVLTASIDNKAILWDITNPTPLQIFDHSDIVPCTRFHPMVIETFVFRVPYSQLG